MNIKFFYDETPLPQCLTSAGNEVEYAVPEKAWRVTREKMEEFGYRTALMYDTKGEPNLFYQMTTKGIRCCEVSERNNMLEGVSLSSEES